MTNYKHTPVLLKEVLEFLDPKSGGLYFDGTLGGGGYTEAILERSGPDGRVIGFDIDTDAIAAASEKLGRYGKRFEAVNKNYSEIKKYCDERSLKFNGLVLDLGVSSHQFDKAERGFSFSADGPLDMRMSKKLEVTAADLANSLPENELIRLITEYGEEKFAGRIARRIVELRRVRPFATTGELEEVCYLSYPPKLRRGRIHPATLTFQAFRIAVNGEIENLKNFLKEICDVIAESARVVVVSYHSLEDRMVKENFKALTRERGFKALTKKPVISAEEEIEKNPRARSAKLRAIAKD